MKTATSDLNIFKSLVEFSPEQRQLFELLLKQQGEDLAQFKIPKRHGSDDIPLSYAQERIWTVAQLTADAAVDNVPLAFRILGNFNLIAFEKSVALLIQRNEVLRTVCSLRNQQPTQVVLSTYNPQIKIIDLSDLPPEQRLETAVQQAEEIARSPFDLTQDLLLRVVVFQLGVKEFVVLLVAHQFVTDGLSFRFLLQELATLYTAILDQNLAFLKEPTIQYSDFAAWQQQWFTDTSFESQIAYWKQQLSTAPVQLNLPTYQNRKFAGHQGAYESFKFSAALSDRVRSVCREQGVTPFMAFVALFQALLNRYTQQPDICIGTLTSNRNRREVEKLVGNFSNNLLLRTSFSPEFSFVDVLNQVRETILDAYMHQDVPFQHLSQSLRNIPQFQVLLLMRDSSTAQNFNLPDLQIQDLAIDLGLTRMELSLDITDDGKQPIFGKLEYKTQLFDASTIQQILRNLQALLESVLDRPEQKIAEIILPELIAEVSTNEQEQSSAIAETLSSPNSSVQIEATEFTSPKTEVEAVLTAIWIELLNTSKVGIHDNFFDLGGHSLLAVKLFAEIEKHFQKTLPLATLLKAPTISQLAAAIQHTEDNAPWSPLVQLQAGDPEKIPLLCIHGAGFNVLIYRSLAINLGSDQPVYGIQARGLDGSKPMFDRLENIAADYIREIQALQPQGPYMLAGLSNGGNIALEIAQQLRAQGQQVALLALFDTYALNSVKLLPPVPRFWSALHYLLRYALPQYLCSLPNYILQIRHFNPQILRTLFQTRPHQLVEQQNSSQIAIEQQERAAAELDELENEFFSEVFVQRENPIYSNPVHLREPNSFEKLLNRFSRYVLHHSPWASFSPSTQLKYMNDGISVTIKSLEEHYSKVQRTYVPRPYPGKIILFKAAEFPPGMQIDPHLGWLDIAKGGLEIHQIPGHHTSIMETKLLAKILRSQIQKATENHSE